MAGELERAMAELAKRLQAVEDEKAILRTMSSHGQCIDGGRPEEWVDLFTADGVFEVRFLREQSAGRGFKAAGREKLDKWVRGHIQDPARPAKHLLIAPIITMHGGEATARSYFVTLRYKEGAPHLGSYGAYRDRLVRQDGGWRFRERLADVEG